MATNHILSTTTSFSLYSSVSELRLRIGSWLLSRVFEVLTLSLSGVTCFRYMVVPVCDANFTMTRPSTHFLLG